MGTFFGNGGNNTLVGTGADDYFKGYGGADTITGGGGNDIALYGDSTSSVIVSLATGAGYGGSAEGDVLTGIENLAGSAYDDTLVGNDLVNVLSGAGGADTLKGGGGADQLYGDAGNDTLKGGGGADALRGGDGIDTASYSDANAGVEVRLDGSFAGSGDAAGDTFLSIENLTGSNYGDQLRGDAAVNVLTGLDGADSLSGLGGSDTLIGGLGDDSLNGGGGTDTMIGGAGNDLYSVYSSLDAIIENGGEGFDSVHAYVNYTLPENLESLTLGPGFGVIAGAGNSGDNLLYGNQWNNVLDGGGGNDRVAGYEGTDQLYGGSGADQFLWTNITETSAIAANADFVEDFDFAAGDVLDVGHIDADVYASGNQAFTFIGTAAFSGTPGEINYYHAGGHTYIQLQTGTSADVEGVIRLAGILTPQASWFVL